MWDQAKGERFDELRSREPDLSVAERDELGQMLKELEDAEAAYLRPASERLRIRRRRIESQNQALDALRLRMEEFRRRLQAVLNEMEAERRAIDQERVRILGEGAAARS